MANYSEGTQRLLIVGIAAAVASYIFWPQIQAAFPDLTRDLGRYVGPMMRLDPTEQAPIEDRRGEHGGELGRLGPPPQWGGGGMPPWGEARGEAPPGEAGAGGYPPQGRPYRRWRDCRRGRGGWPQCGPWQDGPAPGDR